MTRKLLVAKSEAAARALHDALELGDGWACTGYHNAQTGNRYDEILVVLPVAKTDLQTQMQDAYITEVFWTKLPPGVWPTVIRIKP